MWSSEGYLSKDSAKELINTLKKNVLSAPVEDPTTGFETSSNPLEDLKRRLANAPVPAADRIVSLDHNSKAFDEFEAALRELGEAIRKSNDFGKMSSGEVENAKDEILQIDLKEKRQWVRPAHIWQVAKSTLLWISERAAGAVTGALAVSALAALARLLGIAF